MTQESLGIGVLGRRRGRPGYHARGNPWIANGAQDSVQRLFHFSERPSKKLVFSITVLK